VHHANSSLLFHSLDPVPEELELEAQVEKAEEANPEPEQGKPQSITTNPWVLCLVNIFMLRMILH
jgi:hypothetical protein